jgi:hypothetical protein
MDDLARIIPAKVDRIHAVSIVARLEKLRVQD